MTNPFYYCQVSIAPVRAEAKDSAEMVTQLLFGEIIELIESDRQWRNVRNIIDGYSGWVDEKLLSPLTEKEMKRWFDRQEPVYNSISTVQTKLGKTTLTKGAFLPNSTTGGQFIIGKESYHLLNEKTIVPADIEQIALSYLNAPYLWGGRTNFGIDCSGFTQMVFRFLNYNLPRDAYQQAEDGQEVQFANVQKGDLAFFDNDAGKITHVGIILDAQRIVHAHGSIRIDQFKKDGIYNGERQLLSHKLCLIKRYF